MPNSLSMWYASFNDWVAKGGCAPVVPSATADPATTTFIVPPTKFY